MQRPAKILYHAHMTRIITNIGITRNEHISEPQIHFQYNPIKTQISLTDHNPSKSPNKFQRSQQKKKPNDKTNQRGRSSPKPQILLEHRQNHTYTKKNKNQKYHLQNNRSKT